MMNSDIKLSLSAVRKGHMERVLGTEWRVKSEFCFTEMWWKRFVNRKAFEPSLEVLIRGCSLFLFLEWIFIELTEPARI